MIEQNTGIPEHFLQQYHRLRDNFNNTKTFWAASVREKAAGYFSTIGFPTIRHEEWKYTNLMPLLRHKYVVAGAPTTISSSDLQHCIIPGLQASMLVFVNGIFAPEHSVMSHKQDGVVITNCANLDDALIQQNLVKYYGSLVPIHLDAVAALNVAASNDGAFIHISRDTVVENPIYIVSINDSRADNTFTQLHNVIVIEQGSNASVIQAHYTLMGKESVMGFSNEITEIVVHANAHLQHYAIQNDIPQSAQVAGTYVHQHENSTYHSCVFSLNGGLLRNNLTTTLAGNAADARLCGLSLLNNTMLTDHHTMVDHAVAQCTSNELYKCILDDRSTGVFNGKIIVRQDAQKTLAYQSSRNIVLSPTAKMNTKPQLEIFADDVKCSHGAATGQLERDTLFYLQARGIPEPEAKILLLQGFAGEILEQVKISALTGWLESQILHRLTPE